MRRASSMVMTSGRRWAARRLDQPRRYPGLAQDVQGEELQPIQIELDRAPGVRGEKFGEVVGELRLGQAVDLVIETRTDAADGAGVGVDGLRLQALELEVLEVGLVLLVEVCLWFGGGRFDDHGGVSSRMVAQSLPRKSRSEDAGQFA